ncbi:MAG: hypothetical protein CM1200mP24_00750 [Gammaproteobacteria bacterium]|nr:MAG: hypothetical protein CM1200mP24_00750 [Gammaproteobacteria bacterium]
MNQREWLGLVSEVALEPDLPICDPHHHLWDHPGNRYLLDELLGTHRLVTMWSLRFLWSVAQSTEPQVQNQCVRVWGN